MNTLVVNCTRLGDLLQTQPVLSGLKRRGDAVGLVCLENFAGAATLLRDVDHVYPLPGASVLAGLDRDWKAGLGAFWTWGTAAARDFAPEGVVNFTASLSVRLLARFLAAGNGGGAAVSGFGIDAMGFGVCSNPWTAFLLSSTRNRGCSPFNLVDQFWQVAGLGAGERAFCLRTPDAAATATAAALLEAEAPAGCKGFVALQLGASNDHRRWPVVRFAALGRMLWERLGLCPVLLGSKGEAGLGERYAAAAQAPCVNVIGRTSLPELAAVLARCGLLVSNDTGTMHLAAGLGVPIVAIFLATAQPWDTGPYRTGACSLEPDLPCHPCQFGKLCPNEHVCRQAIGEDTVFALAGHYLATGAWAGVPRTALDGVRVWESCRDAHGFMDLVSHSGHEHADRTAWVRLQRHFYRAFLEAEPPGVADPGLAEARGALSAPARATVAAELEQAGRLLFLLHEQGNALRAAPLPVLKNRFMTTWQRLESLWNESQFFNVLGYLWMAQSQEGGQDMDSVLGLVGRYRELVSGWESLFVGK
ncbi:MAG: glycosyltransferase family 9 protein [Desulfovibrionaceae bacterium]